MLDLVKTNRGIVMATFVAPFSSWEAANWEAADEADPDGENGRTHPPRVLPSVVADHLDYIKVRPL